MREILERVLSSFLRLGRRFYGQLLGRVCSDGVGRIESLNNLGSNEARLYLLKCAAIFSTKIFYLTKWRVIYLHYV